MSAAGSPAGSPTAGVADGLSGEQIAFRLMQATEAAAAAANAASQAVSALSGGSSGSIHATWWRKQSRMVQSFAQTTKLRTEGQRAGT